MAMTLQTNGVPREMISQVMGHKDMETTNTYLDSFGDAEIERITINYLYKNKKTNMVSVVSKNTKDAKDARLSYETLDFKKNFSLVQIDLQTGRPHQIRVQFASRKHPLFGDQRYGQNLNKVGQQIALWSYKIEIDHPTTKERMEFVCDTPNEYPWNIFNV